MREHIREIREPDVEACIPADVIRQIETEADRLTDVLADLISYSDDIRMENGEGSRCSLQAIESDEEALVLFRHQLEVDPVSGFLNGTKVRQGKSADTLLGNLRKKLRLRISGQTLRTIGSRIADRLQEDLQPERRGMRRGKRPEPVLVGSIKALPGSCGRAAVISAAAVRVGQNTRLLHACAAMKQQRPCWTGTIRSMRWPGLTFRISSAMPEKSGVILPSMWEVPTQERRMTP